MTAVQSANFSVAGEQRCRFYAVIEI